MIRVWGAVLLVAGCGGFGFTLAAGQRRETAMLRRLLGALQEMQWELKFRMTELPELCRIAADASAGEVRGLFLELSQKLERREIIDISGAVNTMTSQRDFPRSIRRNLRQLGSSLGRYDLEGQLQGLLAVQQQCRKDLKEMEDGSEQRLRSYQTLVLCAGAALVILLV